MRQGFSVVILGLERLLPLLHDGSHFLGPLFSFLGRAWNFAVDLNVALWCLVDFLISASLSLLAQLWEVFFHFVDGVFQKLHFSFR